MTISLIGGTTGSGKSLYSVEKFLLPEAYKLNKSLYKPGESRRIVHNIEGISEKMIYWHIFTDVSMSDLQSGFVHFNSSVDIWDYYLEPGLKENDEPRVVFKYLRSNDFLVFDEAQSLFPRTGRMEAESPENGFGSSVPVLKSRSKLSPREEHENRIKRFMFFLTHHRKFGLDILFITQDPHNLLDVIIGLIEISYILNKGVFRGSSKSYTGRIYRGGIIADKMKASTFKATYNIDCFQLYASYKAAEAKERVKTINIYFSTKLKIIYAFIILLVSISIFAGYRAHMSSQSTEKEAVAHVDTNNQTAQVQAASISVYGYTIANDLCQAETSSGLKMLSTVACLHLPYEFGGVMYEFRQKENFANRPGKLF